jgi:hypothetical protein
MSKPRITFLNENAERTIVERGMNALESVQNDIETLLSAEDYETEDLGSLYEYGLEFCPVPYDEDKETIQYFCYQISTGGPGTEVRFYPHRTEFVFLDWFSGVGFDVSGDRVFQQLREWFGELLDFDAEA